MPEVYSPVSGNPSVAPSAPVGQGSEQTAYAGQQPYAPGQTAPDQSSPAYVPQTVVVGGQQPVNQQAAVNSLPPGIYSVPGTDMQPIPQMQAAPSIPDPASQPPAAAYPQPDIQQAAAMAASVAPPQMQGTAAQVVQPPVQIQQPAPSRIYSHNTRAVWHARRSTKATYVIGILLFLAGTFLAGMYWLSVGSPTTIEELPLTQQLLGR